MTKTTETTKTQQTPSRRDWYLSRAFLLYAFVWTLVKAYMLLAGYTSFGHLIHAAHLIGVSDANARLVPWIIDGLFFIGMIGRSPSFSAKTRRSGTAIAFGAGLLSLAGNMYAGSTYGDSAFGALVVGAFLVAEWFSAKLAPVKPRTISPKTAADRAARREAALRAQMTPAQKRRLTIAKNNGESVTAAAERILNGEDAPANAPVSPAVAYTG
jgi:hypothetical protein